MPNAWLDSDLQLPSKVQGNQYVPCEMKLQILFVGHYVMQLWIVFVGDAVCSLELFSDLFYVSFIYWFL